MVNFNEKLGRYLKKWFQVSQQVWFILFVEQGGPLISWAQQTARVDP